MELLPVNSLPRTAGETIPDIINEIEITTTKSPFIEANTVASSLSDIKQNHIIPVFVKDNEPVISHAEFIETALGITMDVFRGEGILRPNVRLSHPIKEEYPKPN